jgi:dipeptidyl aminopeptidase/acylaminoacyl peptidase
LKTGKEKEIFANPDVDLQSLSFSKKRHVLWTAVFETWKIERHFFDAELATIFSEIQTKLPGFEIDLANTNRDETIFILHAGNDRSRGAYYVYDSKSHDLKKLADLSPWIDASKTSEMKPVEYTSRDGLIIHGYLTLPHGKEMTNLPVVVNPHGGPWARDSWGFNPEVQFLASRGYAVLQMNYRGSTGYGQKFWESSFKQWGRAMQDDISDGVKWLISQKIADPKRVAIYGGSYGGYATLAGVTFTPELYACAIDYVGVSNLFTFMKTVPAYWKPFMEEMHEMVGDPEKDKDLMASASPVFHVDRIRAPLFVAQGAKDPRVNIAESNQIVEALKKRGIVVQYMVKENEGHGFHNEENRFDFYRAMEKFLGKYL